MNPRTLRAVGPAILVVAAVASLVWAALFGGATAPLVIADPGPVVRWGLPIATLIFNLSAAAMVGALVLALFALKAGDREFEVALDAASVAAAIFTVSAAAAGFLAFVNAFNATPNAGAEFGAQLARYLTELPLGIAWLITVVAGAVITVLTFAVRTWTPTLFVAILAVAALIPVATQGHAGDQDNHHLAVTALVLHSIGAAAWLGGLLLLVILRPVVSNQRIVVVLTRYSSIALAAFVVVAISGYARAAIGVGAWDQLGSPYGILVLVKVAALLAMGVLGAWYRTRLIGSMERSAASGARDAATRRFWSIIALELAFMGVASGVAAALGRTAPPTEITVVIDRTPAELLAKRPLPPELTIDRWFTEWNIDLIWAFAAGFGIFFYLAGVWRLKRRGDSWPIHRTIFWLLGSLLLFWVTNGPINAYQDFLFSIHMLGHMLLGMAIPILLVVGAPVTLLMRAVRKRDDGTRGGREWVMWAVQSPYGKILTNPFVAAGIFIISLWIFYFTDLFRWAVHDHIGHQWMTAHFLIAGYLFALSLIGIDPVPKRLPYAGRLLLLIGVMAMHAFFGMAIMMQTGLMVAEWYGSTGRTWGPTPMEDQYIGGGIAWSVGEIPTLILAVVVAIQWSRSDDRAQRRDDRHADRTGDAELAAYNERLAELAARDARR